jgi:hypothetical protein
MSVTSFFLWSEFSPVGNLKKIKSSVTHSEDFCEKSAPKSPKFEGKILDSPYLDQVVFSL